MRTLACLLVLGSLLLGTQGGLVARLLFELRREYIAAQLCVNRDVPASTCHGQCFLKKRLAEREQQRSEQQSTFSVSPVLFFLPVVPVAVPARTARPGRYADLRRAAVLAGHPSRLDPPPRLV